MLKQSQNKGKRRKARRGSSLVEYVLSAGLIAGTVAVGLQATNFHQAIITWFNNSSQGQVQGESVVISPLGQ